jgi:hypothetical protein
LDIEYYLIIGPWLLVINNFISKRGII